METNECPLCRGAQWVKVNKGGETQLIPCQCYQADYNRKKLAVAYDQIGPPLRYRDARLDDFLKRKDICDLVPILLEEGQWAYFWGAPGRGKTHLLAAIWGEFWDYGRPALMLSVPDMLDKWRHDYDGNHDRTHSFQAALDTQVLLLDDLGTERVTDWAKEKLNQLIDHRYSQCLQTIITSNLSLEEMGVNLGARVESRIAEVARVLQIDGKDLRIERHTKSNS